MLSSLLVLLIFICGSHINAQDTKNASSKILYPSISLDQNLDPLKTTFYQQLYHKPINVTIGQQLAIVLPSFDSLYNSYSFSFKQLSETEYSQTIAKLESIGTDDQADFQNQDSKNNQSQKNVNIGTQISQNQLPLKCKLIPASAKVYQIISKINDQSGFSQVNFQNKIYIHVSSRQLLYVLNVRSMLISVYYYNDMSIKFLSSFQFPQIKNSNNGQENSQTFYQSHPSISMTLNSKQTQLYIFSTIGIWAIQTKTFLTNIKQISTISGFNPTQIGGIDKVMRGSGSYFVALKKMSKVFIIPQISNNQRALFTQISQFGQDHIFPQDIAIHSSHLFVLDTYKGIYVYRILSDGRAKQLFKINLDNYGGNYKIHVYQLNTLFVNFNDFEGSKVVQINVDIDNQKAELVRFFKNDDYISFLQTYNVFTSSTGFYLKQVSVDQQLDIKYIQNSAQNLLFLVSNYQQILIFPFNVDPRTINSLFNGIKLQYSKVKEIFHIIQDRFLVITQDSIDYVKISIDKPEVNCQIGSQYNQNYRRLPQNLQIVVRSNTSTCQYKNKLFKHKIFYNQNCQLTTQYLIHLNDPEQSNIRKMITYGIVILVVVAFILGLFCLIQWRNQKQMILARLRDEIFKFRNRHRRMQPFVEEHVTAKKEVQMEVPKDIQYIPNEQDQN